MLRQTPPKDEKAYSLAGRACRGACCRAPPPPCGCCLVRCASPASSGSPSRVLSDFISAFDHSPWSKIFWGPTLTVYDSKQKTHPFSGWVSCWACQKSQRHTHPHKVRARPVPLPHQRDEHLAASSVKLMPILAHIINERRRKVRPIVTTRHIPAAPRQTPVHIRETRVTQLVHRRHKLAAGTIHTEEHAATINLIIMVASISATETTLTTQNRHSRPPASTRSHASPSHSGSSAATLSAATASEINPPTTARHFVMRFFSVTSNASP